MTPMTTPHPDRQTSDPVDLALVDDAVHRAEGLAVADPSSRLADAVAAELTTYLAALITPAECHLDRMPHRSPAQRRARDVLADSIGHARSVHHDQQTGAFTNPTARLYLLAGACRLLKNAMVPSW
ncbi:hypothetical protein AB0I94_38885 [Streptomyces sp. NPDC050147]|uniref:hypothetical protein n=1 Tax=Streptomyces sp. NPDC050147 TaxID=3155513 RepID=UPI0034346328